MPPTLLRPEPIDLARNQSGRAGDATHTWAAWKCWDTEKPYINFIGLCPASATPDLVLGQSAAIVQGWEGDRRRAEWKCGGVVLTFLYGLICPQPWALDAAIAGDADLYGGRGTEATGRTDTAIVRFAANDGCAMVVQAWGTAERDARRGREVKTLLRCIGRDMYGVGLDGKPVVSK